jgi:hypothetical protein
MPPARGSGHEFTADDILARRLVRAVGPSCYGHTVPVRGTVPMIK